VVDIRRSMDAAIDVDLVIVPPLRDMADVSDRLPPVERPSKPCSRSSGRMSALATEPAASKASSADMVNRRRSSARAARCSGRA
jgi:hypothetical protein